MEGLIPPGRRRTKTAEQQAAIFQTKDGADKKKTATIKQTTTRDRTFASLLAQGQIPSKGEHCKGPEL